MKSFSDVVVRNTKNKGNGVFALRKFKRGENVFQIEGPISSERTIHSIQIGEFEHITAWKPGMFANHSCNPNCGIKKQNDKVYLCALKTIKSGEEITWDYAMSDYKFNWFMPCSCGSKNCRKNIGGYIFLDKETRRKYKNFLMSYIKTLEKKNIFIARAGKTTAYQDRKKRVQGLGVFANKDFKKGEFIFRFRKGKIINRKDLNKLTKWESNHLDELDGDKFEIVEKPGWLVNHSCDPNAVQKGRSYLALKKIKKGQEISVDYRTKGIFKNKWKCNCGSKSCKGYVISDFFTLSEKSQKLYLPYTLKKIKKAYNRIHKQI